MIHFDEHIFQMGWFNHQHSEKEMNLPTIIDFCNVSFGVEFRFEKYWHALEEIQKPPWDIPMRCK